MYSKSMAKKYKNHFLKYGYLTLAVLILLEAFLYVQPVSSIQPQTASLETITTKPADFAWPAYGQSAFSVPDYSVNQSHGQQKPTPIASVAKIITALAILKEKPLKVGEQGPTITLGAADLSYYQYYAAQGGSVITVTSGEQISEYQALEAMLLPSANNMAQSLAVWAFGSTDQFKTYVSSYLKDLGAIHTHMDDASGFSPATTSTASDLAKIAAQAIDNPTLADIVSHWQADIPTGTTYNTNWLVGSHDVIGIKTGNTDQAGGCFMFAAKRAVGGRNITVVGDILNAPSLNSSMQDSLSLIDTVYANFETTAIVHKNQIIGSYSTPWGAKSNAVAQKDISLLIWKGSEPVVTSNLKNVKTPAITGANVGSITVSNLDQKTSSPVILQNTLANPSLKWRLFR